MKLVQLRREIGRQFFRFAIETLRRLRGHRVQRRDRRDNPREGADVRAHLPPRVQGPARARLSDRPRLRRAEGHGVRVGIV